MPKFLVYPILVLVLIFAGALSFALAQISAPQRHDLSVSKTVKITKKATENPTPTQDPEGSINNQIYKSAKATSQQVSVQPATASNTSVSATASNTSSGSSSPTPTSAPAAVNASENKVTVSINGDSGFEVKVSSGANQCDVLSKSLDQGKIQSLNMRYDNSLGSNAIYQINGIGKDNSVWWTYKVNGQAPSQGCSKVGANNGDNVEWKYIGS